MCIIFIFPPVHVLLASKCAAALSSKGHFGLIRPIIIILIITSIKAITVLLYYNNIRVSASVFIDVCYRCILQSRDGAAF